MLESYKINVYDTIHLLLQAVENVALLIEYSLVSCGLMSCAWHVVSHLRHMTHV